MQRIDGFYLYSTGYSIHPLNSLRGDAPFADWLVDLYVAQGSLETLMQRSVFQLRTSYVAAMKLLDHIKVLTADTTRTAAINFYEAYNITSSLAEFEHVLSAEFGMLNIYLVVKKRGYDTTDLIHNGQVLFPPDLGLKVPEAINDIRQATQCIAYELPTAAGFHLHRANESVIHSYYDATTGGAPRPQGRNIGDYLTELKTKNAGTPKILSALKDLKDLHRNPLIHPEDSLESVDEAIALLGSIHAAIVLMLKEIPEPPPAQPAIASAEGV